jgi:hypothetical protein
VIATAAVRHLSALGGRARLERRAGYRREVLRAYAREVGLSHPALVAIDGLSEDLARVMPLRRARALVLGPAARALATAAVLRSAASVVRRRALAPSSIVALAGGAISLLAVARGGGAKPPNAYMEAAARAIDQLLETDDSGVPFYVFGHTHAAARSPLRPGANAPHYLNAGTWSRLAYGTPEAGDPSRLGFVEVRRAAGGDPVARLLRWNDVAGRIERDERDLAPAATAPAP